MTTTITTADSPLLEMPEAQNYLRIGKTKLHELVNSGALTRVRIGARAYITRASADAFIAGLPTG